MARHSRKHYRGVIGIPDLGDLNVLKYNVKGSDALVGINPFIRALQTVCPQRQVHRAEPECMTIENPITNDCQLVSQFCFDPSRTVNAFIAFAAAVAITIRYWPADKQPSAREGRTLKAG